MKLQIQTLTGQVREVEAEPQHTVLDLKVSDTVKRREGWILTLTGHVGQEEIDPQNLVCRSVAYPGFS